MLSSYNAVAMSFFGTIATQLHAQPSKEVLQTRNTAAKQLVVVMRTELTLE